MILEERPHYLTLFSIFIGDQQIPDWSESGFKAVTGISIYKMWCFNLILSFLVNIETKCHQLLHDGLEKLQARLNFSLWVAGFCCRAHGGDVDAVLGHVVSVGHHGYVDVCMDMRFSLKRESNFHWKKKHFSLFKDFRWFWWKSKRKYLISCWVVCEGWRSGRSWPRGCF